MSERETNKLLESLCVCTQQWVQQEEDFQKAVQMLKAAEET